MMSTYETWKTSAVSAVLLAPTVASTGFAMSDVRNDSVSSTATGNGIGDDPRERPRKR